MDARLRLPGLKKQINKNIAGMSQNAPFKFAPENGLAFFEGLGWRTVEAESVFEAAHQFAALQNGTVVGDC